jgi:phosphoglycolate phosphatase-like HAD superfamily hydrolase
MSISGRTVTDPTAISEASAPRASSWREADAFLFDIDGTILLSKDRTHRYALHRAMRDVFGVETTIDGIAYHGKTDPGILRAALERAGISTDNIDARMPAALDVCRRHGDENVHLFTPTVLPAIPEILEQLHSAGKLLAVSSGNLASIGWIKLSAAGLRHYFQFGAFADQHELREHVFQDAVAEVHRRLGRQATICFIGDTLDDIRAARKAGGRIVAVGTGIFKTEELAALSPDVCVADCAELLSQ